jgi:glycosyltransferase involved in cell wall biosynthesis
VKRHDLLLRAFAQVRKQLQDAHLLIVGAGPLLADLRRLAAELGVDRVTHFLGYQSEPQRYLHLIDVFALTSASEGIPQALLEASAAGIPAVASHVGGVPEVIEDGRTGLLFPNGDVEAFTCGILALLKDRERARRMGGAARARVEFLFHIRRMAAEYHSQFLELLGSKDCGSKRG